ncbi:hypothetical protein BC830DRAFT_532003 [Chytriomyces sp. MP71]|nr:hypothetical protein BC830DRAFT_532003 [Chytriomyces sp. MP71]
MEDIKQLALELVPERKVSSVIRYELCDYPPEGAGETSSSTAMLTVWHPEAGMLETLKEGKRIKFLGLVPDTFGHASTSHIKLKMGKKKTFVEVPATKGQVERSAYQPRKYISMAELESMESGRYFDVIAVVVAVSESFLQVADSSSEHVLQIESRSRRSVIPKIGDIVCFKNLVFVFRNSRVLYSKLEPEYGYQVLTMGHIEKAARPAMQNFLSTSSFTEACERAIISRDRANAKSYVSVAETYHFKNIRGGTGGDTEPDTLTVIFGDSGDRNLFVRSKSRRMLRLGWGEFVTRVTGSKDEGGKHRLLECIVSFLTCLGKHLNRADLGGFNYSVLDEYLLSLALGEHVLNWSRLSEFGPEEETEMHEIWALMCHELSEVFNCA